MVRTRDIAQAPIAQANDEALRRMLGLGVRL
jgi:hypothetical protein